MINDLQFAFRQLLKNPGFTAVALLSLALGIGANTALYSVVYGVLLKPYPYARPQEIWWPGLRSLHPTEGQSIRSYRLREYEEIARLPVFAEAMATSWDDMLLTGEFAPENFRAIRLTGSAFGFLGVPPVVGRTIGPSDIQPGGAPEPVVVLSYVVWQRLFSGDPNAIGRTLRLNDQEHTVIGVMPPRFGWYGSETIWLPLGLDSRDSRTVNPLVRLKPGISRAAAEQQLHNLHLALARENPSRFPSEGFTTVLTNYLEVTVASGEMRTSLQLLFGAVAFLLLIACANVANLQLARASSRAREMAIRLSVGAGRARLVRQLLTESLLLALIGGSLGLLFAAGTTRLMVAMMPAFFVPNEARIELNSSVLLFSMLVSALTGIIFGLAPAFQSSRPDLTEALKDGTRGAGMAASGGRIRGALVVVEVALSVVLLVSAGLTVRSFIALQKVDLGFQPDRILMVDLPLNPKRYRTLEERNRFAQELLERVRNLPGVQSATVGVGGLPFGGPQSTYAIDGQPGSETHRLMLNLVSAGYPTTMGIPLRRGRMLTEHEIDAAFPLAVINEAASALWPAGQDPIGRQIQVELLEKGGPPQLLRPAESSSNVTIVGVIANSRNDGLRDEPQPAVLVPYTLLAPPRRIVAIRANGDARLMLNPLRAQVGEMDREQPLGRPITIEEVVQGQTVQPRFIMALFSLFATLGLALAVAGIYSVLSYLVTSRTHEIGVRMALGAQRSDVFRLILSAGGRLVTAGLALGVLGGFGATRLLRSQLFQVTATDPISFLAVVGLLSVVAWMACYIPARRALRVDPLVALRYE